MIKILTNERRNTFPKTPGLCNWITANMYPDSSLKLFYTVKNLRMSHTCKTVAHTYFVEPIPSATLDHRNCLSESIDLNLSNSLL